MAAGGPVGAGSVISSFFYSDSNSRLFSGIFLSRLKFDGLLTALQIHDLYCRYYR
jgi:hypothetical protein